MDDWENEDFVPDFSANKKGDKWAGEDEEDDVKDNWEDEDEPKKEEADTTENKETQPSAKHKTKSKLAKKIAEREALENGTAESAPQTPEELANEKARVKKVQESEDLNLAREMLGVAQRIDVMDPSTSEEFVTFRESLVDKISLYQKSEHFSTFLETFLTSLATLSETEELKKLGLIFTNVYHERNRQSKDDKKKKQKKKATLNVGRNDISDLVDADSHGGFDDYADDFM